MRTNTIALVCVVCLLSLSSLWAEHWPQWRGPNRDGVAQINAPRTWPAELTTEWKVEVGEGYASPLLVDGRILQFARQGDDEVAMGLDADTGKILWRQSYPTPYEPVESAASPVAADGLIVALVGTNDDGAMVAHQADSGAQKWIWKGDGPAYASPMIVEIDGVKQVVTLTQKYAVGLALASGELLWQIDFPGRSGMNIPTPLRFGQRLVLAGDPGTMLLQVSRQDNSWTAEKTWQISELTMRFSSPVQKGNLIFGFSNRDRGTFFCVDSESGKTLWTSDPRQGDNAVIFLSGDLLLLLKDNAELIVARASGTAFEPLHRYQVADNATYANPLVRPQGIVVKDNNNLSYLTWK